MTHHDHQRRQRGSMDWDERDERGPGDPAGDRQRFSGRDSWVQDRGDYGGWASGEGQGEFARDGYSAQGQFSSQRVAQYGDQGYGQDYGRQGIGWQNRQDDDKQAFGQGTGWDQGPPRGREFRAERQSGGWQGPYGPDSGRSGSRSMRPHEGYGGEGGDWQQGSSGYWGQGSGGGQGMSESGSWRQERPGDWNAQGGSHGQSWEGSGGGTGYSAAGSWMAGPHSGRGPQGYQRSDARIEEDICEHLTHHGMLDATGIQVQVENGEVTLTGIVESRQAKRLAEDVLDSISGIRDIHNQLRVQRDQDHRNPIMAQAQMGHGDGQGSNGQSQSRGQSQREETKAGATTP
jgi:osmotically-inducible protein OsmY